MSTNLSGNILTLGGTSLDESYLKIIKDQYAPTDNCSVGDTVILDGIECLCVATGVTIQGSNLTRIAVDKRYDLGYYQKYVGINQNGVVNTQFNMWRWGGSGTSMSTSQEIGYGLQNTINCLAKPVNYTNGSSASTLSDGYPWLWIGVNDFRSAHSDKWFVPSINELINYVYANKSSLTFDANADNRYWSSSERDSSSSYYVNFSQSPGSNLSNNPKSMDGAVRLCRAF